MTFMEHHFRFILVSDHDILCSPHSEPKRRFPNKILLLNTNQTKKSKYWATQVLKDLKEFESSKSQKYKELKISQYLSLQNKNIPVETEKCIAKTQSNMIETLK